MPPAIPDRYQLQIRLGRVGDVEQWLGTDTSLDRPILVRALGSESGQERRADFVAAVRAAASVSHPHIAAVYAAAVTDHGAFSVEEWVGGVTVADRLMAGDALPLEEILPNGAGLADALALLHGAGCVHGAIGPDSVAFSAAHPAKLFGFGREPRSSHPEDDTAALAATIGAAIIGAPPPANMASPSPSDLRTGVPPVVDEALRLAATGRLDAAGLGAAFWAAPTALPRDESAAGWSWRWFAVAAGLILTAAIAATLGLILRVSPSDSPLLFPVAPAAVTVPEPPPPQTTTTPTPVDLPRAGIVVVTPTVYDPFGDNAERNADLALIADSDSTTFWRTERYFDPLPRIKSGVGVAFLTTGSPRMLDFTATNEVRYTISWSEQVPDDFSGWEHSASGEVSGGRARVQLPGHTDGVWLLWFTDLPAQENGESFFAELFEVRFQP